MPRGGNRKNAGRKPPPEIKVKKTVYLSKNIDEWLKTQPNQSNVIEKSLKLLKKIIDKYKMTNKIHLEYAVISAATALVKNAIAHPENPDGLNLIIQSQYGEVLGEALADLVKFEENVQSDDLIDLLVDKGLLENTTFTISTESTCDNSVEKLLKACNNLYLSIFDECLVNSYQYIIKSEAEQREIKYISNEAVAEFEKAVAEFEKAVAEFKKAVAEFENTLKKIGT